MTGCTYGIIVQKKEGLASDTDGRIRGGLLVPWHGRPGWGKGFRGNSAWISDIFDKIRVIYILIFNNEWL